MELKRSANIKISLLLVSFFLIGCTEKEKDLMKTYSGDGFDIEYPANWVIVDVTDDKPKKGKGTILKIEPSQLSSSNGNPEAFDPSAVIFITVAIGRIANAPDNVNTYSEWHTMELPQNGYSISSVSTRDINGEQATDVIYFRDNKKGGNCSRSLGHAFYFNKYLTDNKNNRLTCIITSFFNCTDKDLLSEATEIMKSIKVSKYSW